jgi:tetratricopeptide (TPR) repeat protein
MKVKYSLFIFIAIFACKVSATDTAQISHLNQLALSCCIRGNADSALKIENDAITLAEQIKDYKGLGIAYNNLATAYFIKREYHSALLNFQKAEKAYEKLGEKGKGDAEAIMASIGFIHEALGEYAIALEYYNRSLKMAKTLGDKKKVAVAIGNIGNIYNIQGEDAKAMDCYLKSLDLKAEVGDKEGVVKTASNIALKYKDRGDNDKALYYYSKALKASQGASNSNLQANTYLNIGQVYFESADMHNALSNDLNALNVVGAQDKPLLASINSSIALAYWKQSDYSKALNYYTTALNLYQDIGDKSSQSTVLGDMGIVCETQGNFPQALDYEFKSLKLCEDLKDKEGIAISNSNIGEIYLKQKEYPDAEKYILQALYLADTIHLLEAIKESNLELSELFAKTNQWQKAFDAYKKYTAAKDSLLKETKRNQMNRIEAKADFDEAIAMRQATENEAIAVEDLRNKNHKIILCFVVGILLITAIVAFILVRIKHKMDKQRELLEAQKEEIKQDSPTP